MAAGFALRMTRRLAILALFLSSSIAFGQDFRVDYTRQSLTGTYIHSQQYLDGIPVIGAERIETIEADGHHDVYQNAARRPRAGVSADVLAPGAGSLVYLNENGVARLASRVIVSDGSWRRWANDYDAATGALLRSDALFWNVQQGRVFDPNPVAKLDDPNLQDDNGSASAVPDAAYSTVDLLGLAPSGPLSGPYVQIVALNQPHPPLADASQSLMFNRAQTGFQEVNAYYLIDKSQRYLQSLGYTGTRAIAGYPVPTDAHGTPTDNSYFISGFTPGKGELVFGDGGTDDAEDATIVLHEYGHAIQESIAPGVWGGSSSSQSRALAEGSADYWSFSSNYEATIASGFDPFCIGAWDARCWNDDPSQFCGYPTGASCLRRTDSTKTMADYIDSDAPGTEHLNGEIWSSALREIFIAMTQRYGVDPGKRLTDTLALEGMFGLPGNPTYAIYARNILDADRALDAGKDVDVICNAMAERSILAPAQCLPVPRGEITWFQSSDRGMTASSITSTLTITDSRTIANLDLQANVAGVSDSDVQISLIGPDGTSVFAKNSFDAFRGHSAGGMWTLVVKTNDGAPATLVSWSLDIQFEGDQPAAARPLAVGETAQTIAAVAHAAGANGTNFISDVRILNRGTIAAQVTAIFTPSGADGTATFAAVKLVIPPAQILTLDDVVQNVMHLSGTGQLQLVGDAAQLAVNSRTHSGSFGESIPAAADSDAIASGDAAISIPGLENTTAFRSNIGFAEIGGASGTVDVRFYDAAGNDVADQTYSVAPFSHLQTSVQPSGEALHAEVTVAGGARVLAYGSVIDNVSGDATFIPAMRATAGIYPAIHAAGANGTLWRTDVWTTNPTSHSATVSRDVRASDGMGSVAVPATGAEVITSRTYTTMGAGSFGEFIAPAMPSTEPATLLGVENDAAFRTNIGAMSLTPATVRFIAYDAAGNEVWRTDAFVDGIVQFPLPVSLTMGRITAEVDEGAGVVPYASVVDNRSGDPTYINSIY